MIVFLIFDRYLLRSVCSKNVDNDELKTDEIFRNTFPNVLDDFVNNKEFEDIDPVIKRYTEVHTFD